MTDADRNKLADDVADLIEGEQRDYFNVNGSRMSAEITLAFNTAICQIAEKVKASIISGGATDTQSIESGK